MTEELEVLAIVATRLDARGIAYVVTGSIADNYYAVPRMTRDIDIVVEPAAGDVEIVLAPFQEDSYVDGDARREAVSSRGMVNLIQHGRVLKVDLIIRKDAEYRLVEFERRWRVALGEFEISIVAMKDICDCLKKVDIEASSSSCFDA